MRIDNSAAPRLRRVSAMHAAGRLVVVAAVALLAGCGREYELAPVSGQVTLNGKPAADVSLTFVPLAKDKSHPNIGPGSLGRTDAEGRFTLRTIEGDDGAVPTEHVVRITTSFSQSGTPSGDELAAPAPATGKASLPKKARDGTLRFRVPPEGTDQADFHF